ncbi:hypothetical protein JG687_00015017 [Phytophthora cactorum]|uniref:Uncharacterized protein n=1 Tax=Phytophthora cactorum TaxID=29920 RepID=A0A8T1TXB8_9STRA|nr:hypothetical protein JG687_00015017 [Phytophthora cactorum]
MEPICDLENHYAAMRKRSLKSVVPKNYWVRTASRKGMAMHAREQMYALDVAAVIQLYAYAEEVLHSKELVETGTAMALPTKIILPMTRELIAIYYHSYREPYDIVKTAKAATRELKNLRRATRKQAGSMALQTSDGGHREDTAESQPN